MPQTTETETNDWIYVSIGKKIREIRVDKLDISQESLAKAINLDRSSIGKIEAGTQRLNLDTLYLLAATFCVSPIDLLPAEFTQTKYVSSPRELLSQAYCAEDFDDSEIQSVVSSVEKLRR